VNGNPLSVSHSSAINSRSPVIGASYDILNDENFIASARVDEQQPEIVARLKEMSNSAVVAAAAAAPSSNLIVQSPPLSPGSHRSKDSSDDGDSDGGNEKDAPSGRVKKRKVANGNDVNRTNTGGILPSWSYPVSSLPELIKNKLVLCIFLNPTQT